jgi:hypothetical protein
MAGELQLARPVVREETFPAGSEFAGNGPTPDLSPTLSACEHRKVSKDGRIVCAQIVEGDNEVSPNICRDCPFKAVNCAHLRFTLRQTESTRLVVRYNGRTEIWNDDPPELYFERAACAAKVVPIYEPRSCARCALRQPLQAPVERPERRRRVAGAGRTVQFLSREALVAAG